MFKLSSGLLFAVLSASVMWGAGESPVAKLPEGLLQEKATAACASCHEARIIVQQRLSKAAWTKEMDKMVKWGAAVDPKDRDALIDYFSGNFGPEQAAYEAPRTDVKPAAKAHAKAAR